MDYEKEILKMKLMGYEVKTVRTFEGGEYYSLVVSSETKTRIDPECRASPFLSKEESIKHAVDSFLRFNKLMKKYGH